ncbi:MAG: hypothetical protein WCV67_15140 [Victivallaceae bacterium]
MIMKRPPILIIINLIILSLGYLGNVYHATGDIVSEVRSEKIITLITLLVMTLFMIGTCTAVLTRHARSVLLLGVLLLLSGFACRNSSEIIVLLFLFTGISFIVWSIGLFGGNSNQPENTFTQPPKIYKYWRYSVITFFAITILLGMLGSYFGDMSRNYESIQKTMFQIMSCFLFAGILQFVIYYILSKRRDYRVKKTNFQKIDGNLQH